ncbi:PDZ domain-containing protein [Mesorhizobium sp.]|uniref:PDZ domain-containing protein n=1 Tax=Mesorhizobium sp. TaxID=1871066 RepID=UPI000FE82636|nr:PDZ domain-containing protein [Mesorhizobium sp.]RWA87142.1 MAG: PDZ domain-containing protein [Mesorhizobium sp.]
MTADLRFQVIRRGVAELVANEGEVAGRLERAQQLSAGHPDTLAAIERLRPMVQRHRDQLATYLKETGGAEPSGEMTSPLSTAREATALSEVLRDLCLAFHHCALSYGMLYELALRLYEPRLREIAPKHLKAHADAALSTARLLPGVVASQLAQDGLLCACICPMCSIGACGCVALGTQTLTTAWRDAVPTESEAPAYVLPNPRPESQLALAGMQGGELVLAVDGQQVHDYWDVQLAIRKHSLGDEVGLLIQRGSETPREFKCQHVSEYPKT